MQAGIEVGGGVDHTTGRGRRVSGWGMLAWRKRGQGHEGVAEQAGHPQATCIGSSGKVYIGA